MTACVYILESSSGKYYVGSTTDVEKRLKHHQGGHSPSTRRLGTVKLALVHPYETLSQARSVERKIKDLKRRDYIEKMIKDGTIRLVP